MRKQADFRVGLSGLGTDDESTSRRKATEGSGVRLLVRLLPFAGVDIITSIVQSVVVAGAFC